MTSESQDPKTLYLYTSLTAGSSTIITATSRLEHMLKAHKVPFKAIDVATDETARRVWRRGNGKTLPGLVKNGVVLGNFKDVEEWVEYGELKQNLGMESAPILPQNATSSTIPGDKSIAERVKQPPAVADADAPETTSTTVAGSSSKAPATPAEEKLPTPAPAPNPMAAAMSTMAAEAAAAAQKKKTDAGKTGK